MGESGGIVVLYAAYGSGALSRLVVWVELGVELPQNPKKSPMAALGLSCAVAGCCFGRCLSGVAGLGGPGRLLASCCHLWPMGI